MSRGVGHTDTPDVLLVAEQLRRAVPGGIGTYIRGLLQGARELDPPDLRLALVASHHAQPDPIANLGFPLEVRRVPAQVMTRAWSAGLGTVPRARVVHAPTFLLPPGRPNLVVTVHDLAFLHHPEAYPAHGRRWHERALDRALERAAAFVVPSALVAESLVAAGADPAAIRVIEEGSDHLGAADIDGARRLLDRLGASGEFLLAVGTLEPRKNLGRLFAAYGSVRASLPVPWPLVVVGPQGWKQSSGALPDGDPPDGVLLAGKVTTGVLAGLYELARLFCCVPIEEGFCLPVAEAMHAGTPVVSSDVPAAAGATLLCDAFSVASIADAVHRGATDEAIRTELVRSGTARSAALTWRHAAEQHVELWRERIVAGDR